MEQITNADVATWLTRIWDEEERIARNAIEVSRGWWLVIQSAAAEPSWAKRYGNAYQHLAQSDPRIALARIEADRKILELHAPSGGECRTCCGEPYMEESWDGETETVEWERTALPWPCPTIRLKAEQYADRPGYQDAWKS